MGRLRRRRGWHSQAARPAPFRRPPPCPMIPGDRARGQVFWHGIDATSRRYLVTPENLEQLAHQAVGASEEERVARGWYIHRFSTSARRRPHAVFGLPPPQRPRL